MAQERLVIKDKKSSCYLEDFRTKGREYSTVAAIVAISLYAIIGDEWILIMTWLCFSTYLVWLGFMDLFENYKGFKKLLCIIKIVLAITPIFMFAILLESGVDLEKLSTFAFAIPFSIYLIYAFILEKYFPRIQEKQKCVNKN